MAWAAPPLSTTTTGLGVRNFYVSKDLYDLNTGSDRDTGRPRLREGLTSGTSAGINLA